MWIRLLPVLFAYTHPSKNSSVAHIWILYGRSVYQCFTFHVLHVCRQNHVTQLTSSIDHKHTSSRTKTFGFPIQMLSFAYERFSLVIADSYASATAKLSQLLRVSRSPRGVQTNPPFSIISISMSDEQRRRRTAARRSRYENAPKGGSTQGNFQLDGCV